MLGWRRTALRHLSNMRRILSFDETHWPRVYVLMRDVSAVSKPHLLSKADVSPWDKQNTGAL
jgi:hypothetical protein